MTKLFALIAGSALALAASQAAAQDAAETAAVLSGSSQTGKASRSLGDAVAGSIGSATQQLRNQNARRTTTRARTRSTRQGSAPVQTLASGDPLENTDAAAYKVSSGATIRVSGRLNPSSAAKCSQNCAEPDATGDGDAPE